MLGALSPIPLSIITASSGLISTLLHIAGHISHSLTDSELFPLLYSTNTESILHVPCAVPDTGSDETWVPVLMELPYKGGRGDQPSATKP